MTSAFFIDLHSIECTLFYSVQVYKKADVIYERPLVHISKYKVEDTTAVSSNEIRGHWVLCKAVRWYGYGCKEYRGGADEVRGC